MIPADQLPLPFSGTLLRPLPFMFNFPVHESWEFQTAVIESDAGNEQRIAVRNPARPRHHVQAEVVCIDRDEAQHLEALLFGGQAFAYGVPLWQDAMELAADVAATDRDISVVDATGRDLAQRLTDEEDLPFMLWTAHDSYEAFCASAVTDDSLTATEPLAQSWKAGQTLVVPLQLMWLAADPDVLRPSARTARATLEFVSGQTPVSANADCGGTDVAGHVQMVRPIGVGVMGASGSLLLHDQDNVGGLVPQSTDPHDLFGYSLGINISSSLKLGWPPQRPGDSWTETMYDTSRGRLTGFSKCTLKCPPEFRSQVEAIGLGPYQPGAVGVSLPVVGADYTMAVLRDPGDTTVPTALPEHSGYITVGSSFSGTGYFPSSPPPATTRAWVVVRACLMGGTLRTFPATSGSEVTSYGRYDVGAPGGIASYSLFTEVNLGTHYLRLAHGYCIRLLNVGAYKGVKVVTEEVLYSSGAPDWIETGTFGTPNVTTHDFTSDDYAAADAGDPIPGFFFSVDAGGTTVFGGAHDEVGDANGDHSYRGYDHGTDHELFRVTVSLYDSLGNYYEQLVDIFPTMLIRMDLGT